MQAEFAPLPKSLSATSDTAYKRFNLRMGILMLLKILLQRESLWTIRALEGFDPRVSIEMSLEGKFSRVLFLASFSGTFELLRSFASWHILLLLKENQ